MTLPAVQVRAAQLDDVDAVVALERVTKGAPHWPREEYVQMIEESAGAVVCRLLLVATVDGNSEIAGFSVSKVIGLGPDVVGEIESVAVAEKARRAGLGRALCGRAIEWCEQLGAGVTELEVRRQSAGAQAMYRGLGFVEVGVRANYYRDPVDDAVLMNRVCREG
jgi:ribosomal protein S18 acetylase RimI-like enzyme